MAVPVRFTGTAVDFGQRRIVMRLIAPPAEFLYPYDIAPDSRIVALTPVPGATPNASLAVLLNWQGALLK